MMTSELQQLLDWIKTMASKNPTGDASFRFEDAAKALSTSGKKWTKDDVHTRLLALGDEGNIKTPVQCQTDQAWMVRPR